MRSRQILEELRLLRVEQVEQNSRTNALMAEIREEARTNREEALTNRDEARLNREVIRRNEIAFSDGTRRVANAMDELRAVGREVGRELIGEMRDLRDESRAQREALLRLIDELRGDGPEPATGS